MGWEKREAVERPRVGVAIVGYRVRKQPSKLYTEVHWVINSSQTLSLAMSYLPHSSSPAQTFVPLQSPSAQWPMCRSREEA